MVELSYYGRSPIASLPLAAEVIRMRDERRAVIEIEAKVPPDEAWEESEMWWTETTRFYGARSSYIFKGPRWVLTAQFPNSAAAARFAGMLFRAEKRASGDRPLGLLNWVVS